MKKIKTEILDEYRDGKTYRLKARIEAGHIAKRPTWETGMRSDG